MHRMMIVAVALGMDFGCGGDPSHEAQLCLDIADAVAQAAERCGQSYEENFEAFIDSAAGGDCDKVDQVRDEDALVNVCIPSLETISCEYLLAGEIDDSCRSQLLR
jgi:hypothetical protein